MAVFLPVQTPDSLKTPPTRPPDHGAKILGRINNLETRLAASGDEVRKSQYLRYDIFYEEMSAKPSAKSSRNKQDVDEYDQYCDHLLVLDRKLDQSARRGQIVGSYRLLRQAQAAKTAGFYSNSEFDIEALLCRHPDKEFLEFGRSCVLAPYRNKRTIELLWQGNWAYVRQHRIDVMFGCASFAGTDPEKLAEPLSFLYHNARAKGQWQISAQQDRAINMNLISAQNLNMKSALRQLPPLVKGYLRLGALIGEEAVIDHQFGTTDILIILPVSLLNPRYVNYYGQNAERHSPAK